MTLVYLLLLAIIALLVLLLLQVRKLRWSVHEWLKFRGTTIRALNEIYKQGLGRQIPPGKPLHDLLLQPADIDESEAAYSGMSRKTWIGVGERLLENILFYSNGMSDPLRLPYSKASGYPRIDIRGQVYGERYAYLEGYARSLFLACGLLSVKPDLRLHGQSVAEYYLDFLLRGCGRYDSAGFGWERPGQPTQVLVEAASICICLRESKGALWDQLSRSEQGLFLSWLDRYKDTTPHWNNWVWFTILINSFLKTEDRPYNRPLMDQCMERVKEQYADDGWYRDGRVFDYYSAWSMQFNPVFWISWDGSSNPALRDELERHNDLFLNSYAHLFSRDGLMPVWGRSVCYRYAATSPFSVAFKRPTPVDFDAGFARYLCSANLRRFVQHPDFLERGTPSLGFFGENATLVDDYSCTASALLSCQSFLALTLPEDHHFWKAPENLGFWSDPPPRKELGATGLWVEHDRATGHTCLHAEQDLQGTRHAGDPRYSRGTFCTGDLGHEAG